MSVEKDCVPPVDEVTTGGTRADQLTRYKASIGPGLEFFKAFSDTTDHQNFVATPADAAFMKGKSAAGVTAFDQRSIQSLHGDTQVALAKKTGVYGRHSSKAKHEALKLAFAHLIATEVPTGRGAVVMDQTTLLMSVQVTTWMHAMLVKMEEETTGKSQCTSAEKYTANGVAADGTKQWVLPFYRREGWDKVRGSDTALESGVDEKVPVTDRHIRFVNSFCGVKGLPQVSAYCPQKKMIVVKPRLKSDTDTDAPPLFDLIYAEGTGKGIWKDLQVKPVSVLTAEQKVELDEFGRVKMAPDAQKVIAMHTVALIRAMHIHDWSHNHITPHSLRVDATDDMAVYLTNVTDVFTQKQLYQAFFYGSDTPAAVEYDKGARAARPAADPYAFDYYSAYATFVSLRLDAAADYVARCPVIPGTYQQTGFDATQFYQAHTNWHTEFAHRTATVAMAK